MKTTVQIATWMCRAAVALVSFVVVSGAQARSSPALGGSLWSAADAECVEPGHGSIRNKCPRVIGMNFPLPIDFAGNKVVRIAAYVPNGSTLQCQSLGTNLEFGVFNNGFVASSTVDRYIELETLPAYVPARGSLIVQCQLGWGVRIVSFDWNQ